MLLPKSHAFIAVANINGCYSDVPQHSASTETTVLDSLTIALRFALIGLMDNVFALTSK